MPGQGCRSTSERLRDVADGPTETQGLALGMTAMGQKRPVTSFTAAYFTILKIVVIACYEAAMIRFIFDLSIGLATIVALAVAFFGKSGAGLRGRSRPWGSVVATPCQFPARPHGRDTFSPARCVRDL